MVRTPWPGWFFSNVAAVLCLMVWSARAWPAAAPELFYGPSVGALQGAALLGGIRLGIMWAKRARAQVTLVPMCLVLGTLGIATALFDGAPSLALPCFTVCCLTVAWGQASMFVTLVHPGAQNDTPPQGDLGTALGVQGAAAVTALGLYHAAPALGVATWHFPVVAAALWALAAGLYLWMQKAAATGVHQGSVSMASLLRHRRWPLLGVTAICGGLAACTPTLWMQSLSCVSGLSMTDGMVPGLVLAGYGIGAKVAAAAAQKPATVRLALAITLLACAGFFLLGMIHFDALPHRLEVLARINDAQAWRRITLEMLLTAMVVLPGSVSTGACLPLVAGAVGNGAPAGAQTLAKVLYAYAAGMVCGAATIPLLAHFVGLEATMRAAALLYAFAALVSSGAATMQRNVVRGLDAAALVTALAIAIWPRWTVRDVDWSNFRQSRADGDRDGLQYRPSLDNMRPHVRRSVLRGDQGSS